MFIPAFLAVLNIKMKVSVFMMRLRNFGFQSRNSIHTSLSDTSIENVILRCLLEIVRQEDWHEFEAIHHKVIEFIRENGLNVGQLSKNRLGTLLCTFTW